VFSWPYHAGSFWHAVLNLSDDTGNIRHSSSMHVVPLFCRLHNTDHGPGYIERWRKVASGEAGGSGIDVKEARHNSVTAAVVRAIVFK
jgi:hypothetical protein